MLQRSFESLDSNNWKVATNNELSRVEKNGIWELAPMPKDKIASPCKWVNVFMFEGNDAKPLYKAFLVVEGFKQEYGVYFEKNFVLVVKMTTLCMLLELATTQDMEIFGCM